MNTVEKVQLVLWIITLTTLLTPVYTPLDKSSANLIKVVNFVNGVSLLIFIVNTAWWIIA